MNSDEESTRQEYPVEIIPNVGYVDQLKTQPLLDNVRDLVIQRRSDCSAELAFEDGVPDPKKVTDLAFRNIARMSMNLLGGLFLPEHAVWVQKEEAHHDWKGGEVNADKLVEFCTPDGETLCFYLRAIDLHDLEFPHPRRYQKESDLKLYNIVNETVDNLSAKAKMVGGKLLVMHRPTNMNYWHVQLELYSTGNDGSLIPYPNSRYEDVKRSLVSAVCNRILAISVPDYPSIPENLYRKPSA